MNHSSGINSGVTPLIGKRSIIALGPLLLLSLPVAAEIYRCEIDDVIVFSDRPCQPSAQPYQSGRSLSISGSAEDLAETKARNQAWLESEAQRREARRAAIVAARPTSVAPEPVPAARPIIGPGFGDWGFPYLEPHADPGQRAREAAQRRPGERGPRDRELPDAASARDRFSALGGRQPGARRDP